MKHHILIILFTSMFLAACAAPIVAAPDAEERGRLSTKMVNLSSAVDTYFGDKTKIPTGNDVTILQNATTHDKRLLDPVFEPYLLKVQYQNPYAVLLLCSKDGKRAIMEDAGCSARLDRQIIQDAPCEFTLHVIKGCLVENADSL